MRSYCALYVDAGYLLSAAATKVTGTSLRSGVRVDHRTLIEALISQVEAESGTALLRVNWYDSGGGRGGLPDFVQDAIGMLPRVKLRLGRLSPTGEQKGVDLRIGLDLAAHGRNRVVDVIYLVSGDDDLTEAVEEAQGHGAQVILLVVSGTDGRPHGVSRNLQREADGLVLIDPAALDAAVTAVRDPHDPHDPETPELVTSGTPGVGPATVTQVTHPSATGVSHLGTGEAARVPPDDSGERTPRVPDSLEAADGSPLHSGNQHDEGAPRITPAALAGTRLRPTVRGAVRASRPAALVYSSQTGTSPGTGTLPVELDEIVDVVCRGVLASFKQTADREQQSELLAQQPDIPRELDRALLVDLSDRTGVYELEDAARYRLRGRFWELAPELLID